MLNRLLPVVLKSALPLAFTVFFILIHFLFLQPVVLHHLLVLFGRHFVVLLHPLLPCFHLTLQELGHFELPLFLVDLVLLFVVDVLPHIIEHHSIIGINDSFSKLALVCCCSQVVRNLQRPVGAFVVANGHRMV